MHQRLPLLAALLVAALPAHAQVTVNPGALEPLGGTPAAAKPQPAHPAPHHPPPHHAAVDAKPPAHATAPASAAKEHAAAHPAAPAKPKPPVVPPVPPPEAVLKPLEPPPPAHPTTPPPPPPVVADAAGLASPIPQGVRITFGPDSAELNAATDRAVQDLAHRTPTATFNVSAFAPGKADDPSTPRRLSLSRALAVRSALINAGVPSTRIYAHALGPNFADGPSDRVDLTMTVPQDASAPPAAPAVPMPKPPEPSVTR